MLIQILAISSGLIFGAKIKNFRQKRSQYHLFKNQRLIPKKKPSSLFQKGKAGVLSTKEIITISLSGGKLRDQHFAQISTLNDSQQLDASEIKLNRNIKGSIGLMGLSLIGSWLYAPLLPIAGIAILYILTPVFKAYQLSLCRATSR